MILASLDNKLALIIDYYLFYLERKRKIPWPEQIVTGSFPRRTQCVVRINLIKNKYYGIRTNASNQTSVRRKKNSGGVGSGDHRIGSGGGLPQGLWQ